MARKDLLKGLMDTPTPSPKPDRTADEAPAPSAPKPRMSKGAIGAVSQSIADLKSRAITEISADLIDDAGVKDRLETDQAEHAALTESIRAYGQQVPVLVRPHPQDADRYQIVYGRRRVAALRDLGIPVKAMIRDLDDAALVMAQGQENSARKDLSFIEKANFARQMSDAGYDRKAMCAALHIDKTVISRMLSVAERVPLGVIELIGSAPAAGRDRWLALADGFGTNGINTRQSTVAVNKSNAKTSDQRFDVVLKLAQSIKPKKIPPQKQPSTKTPLRTDDGIIGQASWGNGRMTLTMDQKTSDGFDEWLVDHIGEIHANWKSSGRG